MARIHNRFRHEENGCNFFPCNTCTCISSKEKFYPWLAKVLMGITDIINLCVCLCICLSFAPSICPKWPYYYSKLCGSQWVNSLWPSDAIWQHRSGSTLAQVILETLSAKCRPFCLGLNMLTLNVRGPSYLGLTRSISWLLMPWLLASPGHQQPWYSLCRISRSLSYSGRNFNYLCLIRVEEWHKFKYMFMPPLKNVARKGLR